MMRNTCWFVLFVLLGVSCLDEPDCFNLNNNMIGVSFKRLSTGKADTVFFSMVTADGFTTVLQGEGSRSAVQLQLNYLENETSFIFSGREQNDTLHLGYLSKAQFLSDSCGERYVLSDLYLPSNSTFDSVRIVNTTPGAGSSVGVNVEIYRCPSTDSVRIAFQEPVKISEIIMGYVSNTIVPGANAIGTINLPLNLTAGSSTIVFNFSDSTTDTLTLRYESIRKTLFNACGEQTILTGLESTSTSFDSLNIVKDSIQDPPVVNVEIIK